MNTIFDSCFQKQNAAAERRKRTAEIIGVIAREHGAKRETKGWSLTCPHCGCKIVIHEQGFVAPLGKFGDCPVAPELERLIQNALRRRP